MSSIKPLTLWAYGPSPNPFKVAIILEELQIPYEMEQLADNQLKVEPFISLNPNGRVPALKDPNTDLVIFESGAIIEYLIEQYDKDNVISSSDLQTKYFEKSWKHFQMSGQGPYFGQLAWFKNYHPEKNITSAIDRYANEVRRVIGVIDAHLTKAKQPYLTGEKVSYADLMWIAYNTFTPMLMGEGWTEEWQTKYPKCYEWHQRLVERPAVKKVLGLQAEIHKARMQQQQAS